MGPEKLLTGRIDTTILYIGVTANKNMILKCTRKGGAWG